MSREEIQKIIKETLNNMGIDEKFLLEIRLLRQDQDRRESMRRTFWNSIIRYITLGALAFMVYGIAVKLELFDIK